MSLIWPHYAQKPPNANNENELLQKSVSRSHDKRVKTEDRENLCGEWDTHKRILTCSSILKKHRTRDMTKSLRFLTEDKMLLHDSGLPKQILLYS